MRSIQKSVFLLGLLALGLPAGSAFARFGLGPGKVPDGGGFFHQLPAALAGDWHHWGRLFTFLQSQWFATVFFAVVAAVLVVFLLHYLVIGAKHFRHDGEQVYFFSLYARIVHFLAALSFTLLVITGLMMVFGVYLGGGPLVRTARYVHIVSAAVFVVPGVLMFTMWFVQMLPRVYDIAWLFILGGYLSKKKKPVPAGKFNAGQKMYFWTATVGGGVMAYTGYYIFSFGAATETVRLYAMIHNVLGIGIVAFYITHLYMSIFAIAGSLGSMVSGYKPKEEVEILHSRYPC